ncbi:DUF72 domain-containing protein [Caenimonas sedimenti]|uniref:DUF72 domain-containing protein n=1 Tax=Caenimonas sedimenti TaxID=2596921 RepID=A0A562ZK80_9BURK|nr:DUF72 domain-containing protein [Caenimonas sedimenti]TWO68736.1 DUF72 domain-containing protein [Caenimonas sedimenti]
MAENILTGSASWTDKSLIACGRFYPPGCNTAEARLKFYATQFPLVEVDSSFYGMPTPGNSQLWVARTPDDFTFNVKAFRLFTGHTAAPSALHRDLQDALGPQAPASLRYPDLPAEIRDELWRRFIEALAPLRSAGKLGAVHFQFSPSVTQSAAGHGLIEHCAERMAGHLLSVEFRHRSWFSDEDKTDATLALLRRLQLVHTVVDAPQGFANTVPGVWDVTNPNLALVRLHGRNAAKWNHRGPASSGRFDYWYSADELAAMVPEIEHLATQARQVHVVFNTNNENQGQLHARMLRELLRHGRGHTG